MSSLFLFPFVSVIVVATLWNLGHIFEDIFEYLGELFYIEHSSPFGESKSSLSGA